MASHINTTLGFSLLQELGSNEIIKKNQACVVIPGGRKHEMILKSSSFNLKGEHLVLGPLKPLCSLSKSNHFVEFDSTMLKSSVVNGDVHETRPEPLSRPEGGFDLSLLSQLMSLETLMRLSSQLPPYVSSSVLYLNRESSKPILDLIVDGNIPFSSSRIELNDTSRNSTRWRKLSRLVPQFQRLDSEILLETVQLNTVNLDAPTLPPVKSKKKTKLKPSPKKQNQKRRDRERDLNKRNHLHAYESLISLMIGSEQHRHITMLSLKKSCGDLSELLTRFSIGIAGTGIAVFFSVVCNVASRHVPFCANKVFDTALGFSLVLLSWTVNRLREAIVDVNRKAIKEEETTNSVDRRIKDVYITAATVIIIFALRFS